MLRGRAQDKAILSLLDEGALPDHLSLKAKLEKIQKETNDILHDDAIVENL